MTAALGKRDRHITCLKSFAWKPQTRLPWSVFPEGNEGTALDRTLRRVQLHCTMREICREDCEAAAREGGGRPQEKFHEAMQHIDEAEVADGVKCCLEGKRSRKEIYPPISRQGGH